MSGRYVAEINRVTPGCILFLLDQSQSMRDPFAGIKSTSKAIAAADAINNLFTELIVRSTQNFSEGPRHYFDVGVIGYGARSGVGPCLGGVLKGRDLVSIAELANNELRVEERSQAIDDGSGQLVTTKVQFPVWFDPVAELGTPMAEAMNRAKKLLKPWLANHMDSYPPIVINITDGEPNTDPTQEARALTSLGSDDGAVLLYNLHLSEVNAEPVTFPGDSAKLPDKYATQLFEISSEIPQPVQDVLRDEGYLVEPGMRGFAFNADGRTMIEFLDIGTRTTPLGAEGEW